MTVEERTRAKLYPGGEGLGDMRNRFVTIGEYRAPRKGERYLSGAYPAAYLAPNDLESAYQIA